MVIYDEDIVLVEDATLIANKNNIIHKENELALKHCSPGQGTCEVENVIYIWKFKLLGCNLKSTKIIPGEVIEFKEFKYFISNQSLLHLQLGPKGRICNRQVYQTDFKALFVLDIQKEQLMDEQISDTEVSVFKDVYIRSKWIYKKLK